MEENKMAGLFKEFIQWENIQIFAYNYIYNDEHLIRNFLWKGVEKWHMSKGRAACVIFGDLSSSWTQKRSVNISKYELRIT